MSNPAQAISQVSLINPIMITDHIMGGGQPNQADLAVLKSLGYNTVINLRGTAESIAFDEVAEVGHLKMTYVAIPIAGDEGLSESNVQILEEALTRNSGSSLVHCASGNRVGALFALKASYRDGMSADESLAFGKKSGLTSLEPTLSRLLQQR